MVAQLLDQQSDVGGRIVSKNALDQFAIERRQAAPAECARALRASRAGDRLRKPIQERMTCGDCHRLPCGVLMPRSLRAFAMARIRLPGY